MFFSSLFGPIVSSDVECCWFKPVQSDIIESHQTKCLIWRMVQETDGSSIWSTVCSSAPHLQFAECTKLHLCIVERNNPTPVRRRFSLTQEGLCIPGGEGPGDGINVWRREVFFCHSIFHLWSDQKAAVVLDLSRFFIGSSAAGPKVLSSRCCVVGVNKIVESVLWVFCTAG